MIKRIVAYFKLMYQKLSVLDRYLLKQVIFVFLMGVFVFSTIIFASDTFITLIKQISQYGIPFKVALIMILLNLPSVIVLSIPMGVLLSTVMVLNRLSLSSEITVMRACGIGLNRIAKPIKTMFSIMRGIRMNPKMRVFVLNPSPTETVLQPLSKQT